MKPTMIQNDSPEGGGGGGGPGGEEGGPGGTLGPISELEEIVSNVLFVTSGMISSPKKYGIKTI